MHGVAAADYAAGLGVVYNLEQVVVAEQSAGAETGLHQLLPHQPHADLAVVHLALGLAVQRGELLRRHDAEIGEHQLAHFLVYVHHAAVVAGVQHGAQIAQIQLLAVRLNYHGAAADVGDLVLPSGAVQQIGRGTDRPDIQIVVVGADGHDPRFGRKLGQKIAGVHLESLEILVQPLRIAGGDCAGCAQSIEFLGVEGELSVGVPGIAAVASEYQRVSGAGLQPVQHGAQSVQHGFKRVYGIGAAFLVAPKQIDDIILSYSPVPAAYHVCQQKPDFF